MSPITETKAFLDYFFKQNAELNAENFKQLSGVLNRRNAIEILLEVLNNPQLLAEVAARSHRHSQGFAKVVLIDDREASGYKLRFHGWPKDVKAGASPLTEDKHEHRWNFASYAMGNMENQRFSIRELNPAELRVWEAFESKMRSKSPIERKSIISQLDQLEALEMGEQSNMLKVMGGFDQLQRKADPEGLEYKLGFNQQELRLLTRILFKYSNSRDKKTGTEIYKPEGPRVFDLVDVQHYDPDTLYFHPVELAHRLFLDTTREEISTLLVTGPVHVDRKPGEFVRSTIGREALLEREREAYQPEELKLILQKWIDHMRKD